MQSNKLMVIENYGWELKKIAKILGVPRTPRTINPPSPRDKINDCLNLNIFLGQESLDCFLDGKVLVVVTQEYAFDYSGDSKLKIFRAFLDHKESEAKDRMDSSVFEHASTWKNLPVQTLMSEIRPVVKE